MVVLRVRLMFGVVRTFVALEWGLRQWLIRGFVYQRQILRPLILLRSHQIGLLLPVVSIGYVLQFLRMEIPVGTY